MSQEPDQWPATVRLLRILRRTFAQWEVEILRPILVTLASAFLLFACSLLFSPVRRFLFSDTVPYPIYCTGEVYSTSEDHTSARTEFWLINTTERELTRQDLQKAVASGEGVVGGPSPDLTLVYNRELGTVVSATADKGFNDTKGEIVVTQRGNDVVIQPMHLRPRAVLRVLIDITGWDTTEVTRALHDAVPFRIERYERGCYSR